MEFYLNMQTYKHININSQYGKMLRRFVRLCIQLLVQTATAPITGSLSLTNNKCKVWSDGMIVSCAGTLLLTNNKCNVWSDGMIVSCAGKLLLTNNKCNVWSDGMIVSCAGTLLLTNN